MRRMVGVALLLALSATPLAPLACARSAPPAITPAPAAPAPTVTEGPAPAASQGPGGWPEAFAAVMAPHGPAHAQPLARGEADREAWLAFVGGSDEATGAFRLTRGPDGAYAPEPVAQWPAAVRVLGGISEGGVTYVLLETLSTLDQPGGLRGVWIDGGGHRSVFETSPLALADVADLGDLAVRVKHPSMLGTAERNATSLVAILRAASSSTGALARALATDGADFGLVWQSTFVQKTGHLDGQGAAPQSLADRALAVVHSALESQACGVDACEAWTDSGHAVVRFVVQGGRWVIRWVLEDAPVPLAPSSAPATALATRRTVEATAEPTVTTAVLHARTREVSRVLAEAPLTTSGGTIGVGLTDLALDAPVIVVQEGAASRTFVVDQVAARKPWTDERWDAAFADVDGDGRTDVVLRMDGLRSGASAAWTEIFLAPPPSVQARSLRADLASALALLEAPDVHAAAQLAVALPSRAVTRDEACRLAASASTPAGFRKTATGDARVLRFEQPGMPTWLPKIVPLAKVTADDVRALGAHCTEMTCSPTRPYCAWSGGTDSQHLWFGLRDGELALTGAADYDGE